MGFFGRKLLVIWWKDLSLWRLVHFVCVYVCVIDWESWAVEAQRVSLDPDRNSYNISKPFTTPPQCNASAFCSSTWWSTLDSKLSFFPKTTCLSRLSDPFLECHPHSFLSDTPKKKTVPSKQESASVRVFCLKAQTCSMVTGAIGGDSSSLIRSSKPYKINNVSAQTGNQDCAACTNQSVLSRSRLHYTRLKRCCASNAPDTLKTFTTMHYSWHPGTW